MHLAYVLPHRGARPSAKSGDCEAKHVLDKSDKHIWIRFHWSDDVIQNGRQGKVESRGTFGGKNYTPQAKNCIDMSIRIKIFSIKNMNAVCKMPVVLSRPQCVCVNCLFFRLWSHHPSLQLCMWHQPSIRPSWYGCCLEPQQRHTVALVVDSPGFPLTSPWAPQMYMWETTELDK